MFILKIKDRQGVELNIGDLVQVHGRYSGSFFARIAFDPERKTIIPFSTFSFHSVEKIDKLPDNVTKADEKYGEYWYSDTPSDTDEKFEKYLISWRECETKINSGAFNIELHNAGELTLDEFCNGRNQARTKNENIMSCCIRNKIAEPKQATAEMLENWVDIGWITRKEKNAIVKDLKREKINSVEIELYRGGGVQILTSNTTIT